jgi:hypothetical protein
MCGRCLLYELITGEFLFNNSDWSQFFVHLTTPSFPLPPRDRLQPLKEALSAEIYEMVERLLEYMLVRDAERRPRVDHVRRQLQLVLQAISRRNPSSYRGAAEGGEAQETSRTTAREGADASARGHHVALSDAPGSALPADVWAPREEDGPREGLWRLSADSYVACVAHWPSLFRCPVRLWDLMAEEDGPPGEPNELGEVRAQAQAQLAAQVPTQTQTLGASVDMSKSSTMNSGRDAVLAEDVDTTFKAEFLPDMWTERPWMDVQRMPASHLGMARIAFFVAMPDRVGPALTATEMELREVELLLESGKAPKRGNTRRSMGAAPSTVLNTAKTPCLVVQINGASATSLPALAECLLDGANGTTLTDRSIDFLVGHDHRGRGVFSIVTAAEETALTPANVLATAVAVLCSMRTSETPLSLLEAILRVKGTYPRAALTPGLVRFLHSAVAGKRWAGPSSPASTINSSYSAKHPG